MKSKYRFVPKNDPVIWFFSNTHWCSFSDGSVYPMGAERIRCGGSGTPSTVRLFNWYLYTMEQSEIRTWVSCSCAHGQHGWPVSGQQSRSRWRHQIETFSALLALCVGNSPVTGEFPTQMPVTRSFDVFFHLCLNKRLSKQSWGWWFETPSRPLWRHRKVRRQAQKNQYLSHIILHFMDFPMTQFVNK